MNEAEAETQKTVYVPQGWCEPTYQVGELVWHNCHQYQITGVAPNHWWLVWSYTVLPVDHNKQPDYIENIQGYLLEHQLGRERPAYCDEQEAAVLHEKSSPSGSETSGVHN